MYFQSLCRDDIPQRLHNVCDLLWRLPKDEVPFAVVKCQLLNGDSILTVNVLIVGQGICTEGQHV